MTEDEMGVLTQLDAHLSRTLEILPVMYGSAVKEEIEKIVIMRCCLQEAAKAIRQNGLVKP